MNDDLDVMRRLVDFHDHISAPPVLVADDVHRGRRRVRRYRRRLVGGVALGLASMVAAVSLVTGGGSTDSPQPVGPPTTSTSDAGPDSPGLNAPMVAPTSILDVRELGFHVEGLPAQNALLRPDGQLIEVVVANSSFAVEVYYQGKAPGLLASDRPRQEVRIHGVAGTFVERYESGSNLAYLVWEYAPDSWAVVRRSDDRYMPSREAEILTIAEAIRPDGAAVRLPFRVDSTSAPMLLAETVGEVHLPQDTESWRLDFESGLIIMGNPVAFGSPCDPPPTSPQSIEAFTYRGYAGCLHRAGNDEAQVSAVVLQVDGTDRMISDYGSSLAGYEIDDLKQLLAEITVAPSEDPATWFDLTTALGG